MRREWKPGDVVTATVNGRPGVRLIAGWSKFDPQLRWAELSTRWADGDDDESWFMPSQVTDHRPLVVIDPEDREQVERLMPPNWHRDFEMIDWLQDHIRSLVAQPKPPEPTGLGAVVEDGDGRLWVNTADMDDDGHAWWMCADQPAWYADIAAVRVLSEGVAA